MYGTGHSEPPARHELRVALERLEAMLARQQQVLREAEGQGHDCLEMLRRSIAMMGEELERLRAELAA